MSLKKYDIHAFGPLLATFEMPEELTDWLLEEANKVRGNEELSANKNLAGQLKEQYYFPDKIREEFKKGKLFENLIEKYLIKNNHMLKL